MEVDGCMNLTDADLWSFIGVVQIVCYVITFFELNQEMLISMNHY